MQVETMNFGDWAQDAYHALHDDMHASSDKWLDLGGNTSPVLQSAFSITPSLLTQSSVERYGQLTPPEELSPAEPAADPRRDSAREGSIPVKQLKNETLFPEHQLRALQDYQPNQASQSQDAAEPSPKRRRTGRQPPAKALDPTSSQPEQATANPQPAKRKRGRPKYVTFPPALRLSFRSISRPSHDFVCGLGPSVDTVSHVQLRQRDDKLCHKKPR